MTPKIICESGLNIDRRFYYLDIRVSNKHIAHLYLPLQDYYNESIEELGAVAGAIVRGLNDIPGLTEIFILMYGIDVYKSPAFEWQEIEPEIIKLLKKVLAGYGNDVEEVQAIGEIRAAPEV